MSKLKLNDICGCRECEVCLQYGLGLEENKHLKDFFYQKANITTEILKALLKNDTRVDVSNVDKSIFIIRDYTKLAVDAAETILYETYYNFKNVDIAVDDV